MSLTRLPRWLRHCTRPTRRCGPRPPARSRPRLEPLEDRTAPAAFPVTSLADSVTPVPPGSLRQAIIDANATPGDDTITFSVTGTINLAGALPDLSSNIDLQGPGANLLTVRRDTGGDYRIFTVPAGATVTLSGLTVANGSVNGDDGGGIWNGGTLTVTSSTLSGNRATPVFPLAGGNGGGVYNAGTLTVTGSTLSGNSALDGGGISNVGSGTLTVTGSTFSVNGAFDVSGIVNFGRLTLASSTLSGNSVGIATMSVFGATTSLRNTIVAGSSPFPDVLGSLDSQGHNLIGDGSRGSGYTDTDLVGTPESPIDPRLGPLQDNGGPTLTHALLPGSPALDAGDNTDAPATDQRGFTRIVGGRIDIGSFEVQVGPVASIFLFPFVATVPAGTPVDLYVVALDAYGHLVTDYAGTVYLVSTDPAVPPVSYTFRPEDGGIAHLTDAVTFRTPGPQLLLAIDATFTAIGLGLYDVA